MKHKIAMSLLLAAAAAAQTSGLRGLVRVRLPNGEVGSAIRGVDLRFAGENTVFSAVATTDMTGRYEVSLAPGRYYVLASHRLYQDYASAPDVATVKESEIRTRDVFLREPAATTVLLVRHAEKYIITSTEDAIQDAIDALMPLTNDGLTRAQTLKETVLRAGVTAVFSTETVRTRSTVRPYAELMQLPINTYSSPANLAETIFQRHRGDVVLVGTHGSMVDGIAEALGVVVPENQKGDIGDYDNLYVITRTLQKVIYPDFGWQVVNLQYGAESQAQNVKKRSLNTTFLLIRCQPGMNPPGAQTLRHALCKAGVAAIRHNGCAGLVQPLAEDPDTNVTPVPFTTATLTNMVADLLASFAGKVVLVAGTDNDLSAVVTHLRGDLTPILLPFDTTDLILATRVQPGRTRVVPLRFLP